MILNDKIYIDKSKIGNKFKKILRNFARYKNPEFFKRKRMNYSTYNIKAFIDCSEEDDNYLIFPRGNYDDIYKFCLSNKISMEISDKRNSGKYINTTFNGKLREEQEIVLNNMIKHDIGILQAPPGYGKTILALKLIDTKKVNTLIITNRRDILRQWKNKIKVLLNIDAGEISGDKINITKVIDVAIINSLSKKETMRGILKEYGMVIVDECHHASAPTYVNILNSTNAKHVYGFTQLQIEKMAELLLNLCSVVISFTK